MIWSLWHQTGYSGAAGRAYTVGALTSFCQDDDLKMMYGEQFHGIHRPLRPLVHPHLTTARHAAPLGRFIMARSTVLCWAGQLWHFNESLNPRITRLDVLSRATRVTGILFSSCHSLWTTKLCFVHTVSRACPIIRMMNLSMVSVLLVLFVSGQVCKVDVTSTNIRHNSALLCA